MITKTLPYFHISKFLFAIGVCVWLWGLLIMSIFSTWEGLVKFFLIGLIFLTGCGIYMWKF